MEPNDSLGLSPEECALLRVGQQAMDAMKKDFSHWVDGIGPALQMLKTKPGADNRKRWKTIREEAGFDAISPSVVSLLLSKVMPNVDAVKAWHTRLPANQQFLYCSPGAIVRHCPIFNKPAAPKEKKKESEYNKLQTEHAAVLEELHQLKQRPPPLAATAASVPDLDTSLRGFLSGFREADTNTKAERLGTLASTVRQYLAREDMDDLVIALRAADQPSDDNEPTKRELRTTKKAEQTALPASHEPAPDPVEVEPEPAPIAKSTPDHVDAKIEVPASVPELKWVPVMPGKRWSAYPPDNDDYHYLTEKRIEKARGTYKLVRRGPKINSRDNADLGKHKSLKEAKAAAQADYSLRQQNRAKTAVLALAESAAASPATTPASESTPAKALKLLSDTEVLEQAAAIPAPDPVQHRANIAALNQQLGQALNQVLKPASPAGSRGTGRKRSIATAGKVILNF